MIKHNEIVDIEAGNPFGKCQLDRKKYADVLTNIVSTYADGFVLAINNKWGTGKTTFIRMWERDLKDKGFKTVLFNAWENDFENNALTALMGELKTLTKKDEVNPNFEKALKNAAIFTKNLAPVLVKAVVKKYVGESFEDLSDGVAKSIGDIFEKDVNEYADKKKSIKEFRDSLKDFIANTWDGKPVVFIIDELDRCRPDYAVSILEQIKHFFSIPNIVFVLSIDKEQLGHAVRGVYGSESIDADEYLRRFIDIEYSIPEPDTDKYVDYLYGYYKFDEFFNSPYRKNHHELNYDSTAFLKITKILFKNRALSLRKQEKIFAHSRLVLKSFPENNYVFPSLFLFLNYIKITDTALYNKVKSKELTISELQAEFVNSIRHKNVDDNRDVLFLEAYLVHYYNNYSYSNYIRKKLYERDVTTGNNKLLIDSVIDISPMYRDFLQILENMSSGFRGGDLDIGYLLNKIDLLDNFKE
jgi:KAP family P-loop domain